MTPALSLQQAKFAFYRCSMLLRWRLPHTLFCTLAWETGVCARHFLWSCLVRGCGWGAGPWAAAGKGRQGRELVPQMTSMLSSGQMTQSQEEFSIHLSQALSYLHSHHHHIRTWAALFIGDCT